MSTINDGGTAFPTVPQCHGYSQDTPGAGTGCGPGMSLHAYFAGQAMIGLIASRMYRDYRGTDWGYIASDSRRAADALIAELKKGGSK